MRLSSRPTYLLDTSIQVKRLLSKRWLDAGLDKLWVVVEPTTCMYSFMEFKNSVVGALRFLVDVLKEIEGEGAGDEGEAVRVRLGEVVEWMNCDTRVRTGDRRARMANAYAARVLAECGGYAKGRRVVDVIEHLKFEAEELEEVWFWWFVREGQRTRMGTIDIVRCHVAHHSSPMTQGCAGYGCRRGESECGIIEFLGCEEARGVVSRVVDGDVRVRSKRLRDGARKLQGACGDGTTLGEGRSIGQRLCLPVGDCVIVAKASAEGVGLVTGDRDQVAMAERADVAVLFYDARVNAVI